MRKRQNDFTIPYKIHEIEGQCTLKQIKCLRFIKWKFILYCVISVVTLGIPMLICYWYPWLIKQLYYDFVPLKISTHFYVINYDDAVTIVSKEYGIIYLNQQESIETMFFTNRYLKYYYNHEEECFIAVTYNFFPHINNLINTYKISGHNQQQVEQLRNCYGFGTMILPTPSCLILFARQILQPFFVFIIYSTILWFIDDYMYYALVILLTSTVTIWINLYQIMEINKKIFEMAYYDVKIHSLRNGNIIEISSVDIVPGDIVFINNTLKLPFDGILLGGSVLMNQCVLTGESVPIVKKAINKQQFNLKKTFDNSCLVFQGTEVVQICSKSSNAVHAPFQKYGLIVCVTKTNFTTIKGQLIRTISFPKARQMKFYIESAKFVGFLILIAIVSYCFLMIKLVKVAPASQLAITIFDLIIITVPPGLPASMSLGIAYSIRRLKQLQIFCISPDKIILGGRINHICFDKTGTLTQLYMDFHQFCPSFFGQFQISLNLNNQNPTSSISRTVFSHINYQHSLVNMATCHSIVNLQQTGQLAGDPMQIKLFKFGKFQLINFCQLTQNFSSKLFCFKNQNIQGSVFRRFEFHSEVNRMSVIAYTSIDKNNAYVYCKGSPEQLLKVMRKDSIPPNYLQQLKRYTSSGLRVLSICSKKISISQIEIIDRQTAESQLVFNGFEVFQNKLKPETIPTIKQLKQANIGMVIITGDNSFIGTNIALKSRIISHSLTVLICQLIESDYISVFNFEQIQEKKQQNQNIPKSVCLVQEDSGYDLSQRSQRIIKSIKYTCSIEDFPNVSLQYIHKQQCILCITGEIFQKVYNQQQNGHITDTKKQFLKYIKVFARSKPNDKTKIVSMFQQIGKITAMCGDGANDCGALKQADIGLSLSDAQASISAPFTSNIQNISSIINLIRQCRGGLATNFSLFNIMALYSLTQFSSTVITIYFYTSPSDIQYLYWDVACNFLFFLTIGYTSTQEKLSKLLPSDSLFSVSNLICVIIMFSLQFICQIVSIVIMSNQPFSSYINYWQIGGQINNLINFEQQGQFLAYAAEPTAIFMVSNFVYLFSVIGFSISSPWKKSIFTNYLFMPIYMVIFLYSILICIVPQTRFIEFNMFDFEIKFNSMILGIGIIFGFIMCFNQKYILQPLFRKLRQKYPDKKWL